MSYSKLKAISSWFGRKEKKKEEQKKKEQKKKEEQQTPVEKNILDLVPEDQRNDFEYAMLPLTLLKPLNLDSSYFKSPLRGFMINAEKLEKTDAGGAGKRYEQASIKALLDIGLLKTAEELEKTGDENFDHILKVIESTGLKYTRDKVKDLVNDIQENFIKALSKYEKLIPSTTKYSLVLKYPDTAIEYAMQEYIKRIKEGLKELKIREKELKII